MALTEHDLAAARQGFAEATDVERTAFATVDQLREELALGRSSRGQLQTAQNRLARTQEAAAQAAARVRAIERALAAERDRLAAIDAAEARRIAAEVRAERAAMSARIRDTIDDFLAAMGAFDDAVRAHNRRHGSPFVAPFRGPSDFNDFGRLTEAAGRLRNRYT